MRELRPGLSASAGLIAATLLLAACQNFGAGGRQEVETGPQGPIAGVPLDQMAPLASLSYEEGPSLGGYWWRFSASGQHLDIGRRPGQTPAIMVELSGPTVSFDQDLETEGFRLETEGDFGEGFTRFYGLTPGNQPQEPYGLIALTNEGGTDALYGLMGEGELAPTAGAEHFIGGSLLSRRQGSNALPTFAAKAQARLEGDRRPQRIALLLTVPRELPRLFGRRVGAIQLHADFDPVDLTFRAQDAQVVGVGAGATNRLRLTRFSLVGKVLNDGDSLAGLYRLSNDAGEAIVVGAFTLQSTDRSGPLTSQR
ncbi:MAG: hypothetical protein AAFY02_11345 [Pseudomonadota bacterium]